VAKAKGLQRLHLIRLAMGAERQAVIDLYKTVSVPAYVGVHLVSGYLHPYAIIWAADFQRDW